MDLYPARQHLWDLGGKLHPNNETAKRRWVMSRQHLLDDGKIDKLVAKLRTLSPENPELAAAVRTEANDFERNAERMRYPDFRRKALFVGSGVIEAGCKTVIGTRLKRSGVFWTVRGHPEVSILVHRMASDEPKIMMPELGRTIAHKEGVELVREWLTSLRGGCQSTRPSI